MLVNFSQLKRTAPTDEWLVEDGSYGRVESVTTLVDAVRVRTVAVALLRWHDPGSLTRLHWLGTGRGKRWARADHGAGGPQCAAPARCAAREPRRVAGRRLRLAYVLTMGADTDSGSDSEQKPVPEPEPEQPAR